MDVVTFLPKVKIYLSTMDWSVVPGWQLQEPVQVRPLAQGEYNMNYLVTQGANHCVLRVNLGSQIGLTPSEQIRYEYQTLKLLEHSGITPQPYGLDDTKTALEYGTLLMEYIAGEPLRYETDILAAASLFAHLHSTPVPPTQNHLIHESQPLSQMYAECSRLASVYLTSELRDPAVTAYLTEVLDWANSARMQEAFFLADPCWSIINTEVNSGNFIANRKTQTLHLVDWEKALWGDPSQDLSHFSVPTTTLWKTEYRMSGRDRNAFLAAYQREVLDPHLRDTIVERVHLRDPFNCLRGVTWSAMAYVQYQTGSHSLRNPDTFKKIQDYLNLDFLRSLFDGYLEPKRVETLWE